MSIENNNKIEWSTIQSKSAYELVKKPDKEDLVGLFIDHLPEVSKDANLLTKLCTVLNHAPSNLVNRAKEVFAKKVTIEGARARIKGLPFPLPLNFTALTFACSYCDLETIKKLLARCDINGLDTDKKSPLRSAIEAGRIDVATFLIESGAKREASALLAACQWGDLNFVKFLCNQKHLQEIDGRDRVGHTPLMIAVTHGHEQIVRYLIELGAPLQSVDESGWTALHFACSVGNLPITKLLCHSNQLSELAMRTTRGRIPLDAAISGKHVPVVTYLIEQLIKNDPTRCHLNLTPLHYVCEVGPLKAVALLCDEKNLKWLNVQNSKGQAPLMVAQELNRADVADYLIKLGAYQSTLIDLFSFCKMGQLKALKKVCNQKNIDACEVGNGQTLLMVATLANQPEIVKYLLEQGANPALVDGTGSSALSHACRLGKLNIVQLLCPPRRKSELNSYDSEGQTPLMRAATSGQRDVVSYLIELGANRMAKSPDGSNALHFASSAGHLEVVKLLCNSTTLNAENNKKESPIEIAIEKNQTAVLKYLTDQKIMQQNLNLFVNACADGNLEDAKQLYGDTTNQVHLPILEEGSPQRSQTWFGLALRMALDNKQKKIVNYLLECLIALDKQKSSDGWTPLHLACDAGDLKAVKLLCTTPDQLKIEDKNGKTPLMIARERNRDKVVGYLLELSIPVQPEHDLKAGVLIRN